MGEISIERLHALDLLEARRRIAKLEAKLRGHFGVELRWNGQQATLTSSGLSAFLAIGEKRLAIRLTLGSVFEPVATKIQALLESHLDRSFPETTSS